MVNVAVLGFGTVGSGVVELIDVNHEKIAASAACEICVKYILDVREFPNSPYMERVISDFSIIENDPEVQVVVETIGGVGVAYEFTKRSLLAGKSVVTSNKELVAQHGYELVHLARERNLNYLFEASVGGGIPILRPINQCLAANEINEIYGILNGTTNYILTRMIQNGTSFETALREAQVKGYAEAKPDADVLGYDTCRKICILAALSFGRHIYPEQVPTKGIESVEGEDIELLRTVGAKIKLIGRAVRTGAGRVAAYVAPHVVLSGNLLVNVEDVFNSIVVRGNATGDTMFYGRGAGKLPTASAVVADVIDAVKHVRARKYVDWEEGGEDAVSDYRCLKNRRYVRADVSPEAAQAALGPLRVLGELYGSIAFLTERAVDDATLEKALSGRAIYAQYRVLE